MATDTHARDVGEKLDLLNSNKNFFKKIKNFYDDYGAIKDITSSVKSRILVKSETTDFSNISIDEKEKLEAQINKLKEKIKIFDSSKNPYDALEKYKANKELLELEATLELYEGKSYDEVIHFINEKFLKYNFSFEDALKLTVKRRIDYIETELLDKYKYTPEEIYLCLEDLLKIKDNIILAGVDSNFKEQIYNYIYGQLGLVYYPNEINSQSDNTIDVSKEAPKHPHPVLRELYYSGEAIVKEKKKKEEEEKKAEEENKEENDEEIDDDKKDDPEEEQDDEKDKKPTDIQPNVNAKWRTIASIAAGIGLGASVWFGFGAAGVAVLTIGGGIAKRLLAKKQAQLQELKQNGQLKIHKADDFPKTLVGQLQRFRSYINSPEGLDAVQKVLTSSILTSVGFNIFGPMLGLEGGQVISAIKDLSSTAGTGATTVGTNAVTNATPAQTGVQTGDLRVGDSVGNLTTGYTDSINAASGTNTVSLNQSLINNDTSQIGSFLVRKGSESFTINDPSLTISDIVNKYGVAETDIVANVVQNGTLEPQSWNPLTDIANAKNAINTLGQGGRTI